MIRTVLGDIPADTLGICNAHDHLFMATPKLPGQELDDPDAATAELKAFGALGGGAVAQWTPHGLGRRADDLPWVSKAAGVHVIAATGLHQAEFTPPDVVARVKNQLGELFTSELTQGIEGTGVKAGMIKVAGGFHGLDEHARATMTAAAEAQKATGSPIGVHLELGTGALDVLELLCGRLEVPPDRVILGHLNRSPDFRVHRQAAEAGAFLAFDGPSRANHATDWRLFDALIALAEAGHAGQVLLGGDTTTAAARGNPGMPHLLRVIKPGLEKELGEAAVKGFFVGNPARAFDWATEDRAT
ncbi:phosphotriesterase family protein [Amycolatopsis xylanica]|uniref:phosphotriesterase family protein n=1 Tax=Amycolatopsis xylanica TaxID=589385 RepID=UPI001FE1A172|nr:phosphotriesterase [Amycolatopsis xylanica]